MHYLIKKKIYFFKILFTRIKDRPKKYSKSYYIKLANSIILGNYGNGSKRVQKLINDGYNVKEIAYVQSLINKSMGKKIKGIKFVLFYLFA